MKIVNVNLFFSGSTGFEGMREERALGKLYHLICTRHSSTAWYKRQHLSRFSCQPIAVCRAEEQVRTATEIRLAKSALGH